MKPYRLSKSRLMDFLQCPKKLYLRTHHPELAEDSPKDAPNKYLRGAMLFKIN